MKIAVITCVNNEEEYAQALSYIDRLHVPDGYELDVIAVREAPSMAPATRWRWNIQMPDIRSICIMYIHQSQEFLQDMLSVFRSVTGSG